MYNISVVVDNRLSMSKGTVDDFDKREEDEHFQESESSIRVHRSQSTPQIGRNKILFGAACFITLIIIINYSLYLGNGDHMLELQKKLREANQVIFALLSQRNQTQSQIQSLKQELTVLSSRCYSFRIEEKRKQGKGMGTIADGSVSEIRLLSRNKEGKGIEDFLYSEEERKKRDEFNRNRIAIIEKNKHVESLVLSKFTLKTDEGSTEEEVRVEGREYERVRKLHGLDSFDSQLPMCIVVAGFNNKANFRLEYNLNSIFLQNYSNYFAVIINDASTDGSDELFPKYFDFYKINQSKYAYINNKQRCTALQNIYIAITEYCSEDAIVVNLDGDDELIGKNVLKIFNAHYQKTKMGVIYSNYVRFHKDSRIEGGWTKQYPPEVKNKRNFRTSPQFFSHLKTHRASLFRQIPLKELKDDKGVFYKITSDMAVYYPLMELACGKVLKIEGYHYLYNFNTGLNDYTVNHKEQLQVEARVKGGKKLECAKGWE